MRADYCEAVGLIIHYCDAHRVDYIEVHEARYATVTLTLSDRDITGISVGGLVEFLGRRGVKAQKTH